MNYDNLENKLGLMPGTIRRLLKAPEASRYSAIIIRRKHAVANSAKVRSKPRKVFAPSLDLKKVQRAIAKLISNRFTPHPIAHAYLCQRSIISNAEQHINANSILKIDLVNFFGSIRQSSVIEQLSDFLSDFHPFEISTIASLCCYKGFIPQGSPASPILSNLICRAFDNEIEELARSFECSVTRYSDDICFSTAAASFPKELAVAERLGAVRIVKLGSALSSLIDRHGFKVNSRKLRLHTRPERLRVTGLIVGRRVSVPKVFRQNIRAILNHWKTHGIIQAAQNYRRNATAQSFRTCLRGYLGFIGQVAGKNDAQYLKLIALFDRLSARDRAHWDACSTDPPHR